MSRVDDEDRDVGSLEDAPQLAPHLDVLLEGGGVAAAGLDEPALHGGDPADERLALAGAGGRI